MARSVTAPRVERRRRPACTPRARCPCHRIAITVLLAVVIAGVVVGRKLRVNYVRVPIGIPTPLRIVVLGDFHMAVAGIGRGMAEKAVQEAMRQRPDVIILLGDYVSGRPGISNIHSVFKGMHAPLGVYAVLGNHEHWTDAKVVREELEALGIRVLVNEDVVLSKGDTRLALVAIDDLWAGKVDWQAAYRNVPKNVPILLASHNPDAALDPQGRRAALIVSGHTHGGQVWMPSIMRVGMHRFAGTGWPPKSDYGRAHPYGLMHERWGWSYITSGVVQRFTLPRWFTEAEAAVLELK